MGQWQTRAFGVIQLDQEAAALTGTDVDGALREGGALRDWVPVLAHDLEGVANQSERGVTSARG